jgi:hypothetical protein
MLGKNCAASAACVVRDTPGFAGALLTDRDGSVRLERSMRNISFVIMTGDLDRHRSVCC